MLRTENVSKFYEGRPEQVLKRISLEIAPGEIYALLGESGSGKSTLMRLLAGLEQPDEGKVFFDGERLRGPQEKLMPGHPAIRMAFQHFELFPDVSVRGNIAFPLRHENKDFQAYRVDHLLQMCKLGPIAEQTAKRLSGGEKQRTALAMALADEPAVLILDEPFSHLDPALKNELGRDIHAIIRQEGLAAVFASHDTRDALSFADRVGVLRGGQLLQEATPKEIYDKPRDCYTARLFGEPNLLPYHPLLAQRLGIAKGFGPEHFLCIRPENVRMSEQAALSGELQACWYEGERYRAEATTDFGPLHFFHPEPLAKGRQVCLAVDAWAVVEA